METPVENPRPWRIASGVVALIILGYLVFYFRVGEQSIWAGDIQGMRAEVVREMVASGDWWNLTLNDERYIAKPPLYYWLAAWSSKVVGEVNEFSMRVPAVFSALLGLLATWFVGVRLFGEKTAWLAVFILTTSPLYIMMARASNLDMTLTALTTGTIACFVEALQGTVKRNMWIIAGSILLGLAVLTKGPVGFLVPFFPIGFLAFSLRRPNYSWPSLKTLFFGAVVFSLLTVPWFLWSSLSVPNAASIFYQETLYRFEPKSLTTGKPFYTYGLHLLSGIFPWTFFLPGVVMVLIKSAKGQHFDLKLRFLIAWIVPLFLIFSCAGTKRPWYLLPLLPAISILLAWFWEQAVKQKGSREYALLRAGLWCTCALFLSLGVGAIAVIADGRLGMEVYPMVVFAVIFFLLVAVQYIVIKRRLHSQSFYIIVCAAVLMLLMWVQFWLPKVDQYRSRKEFFQEIATVVSSEPVVNYGYSGYDLQFYMQRSVPNLKKLDDIRAYASKGLDFYVITDDDQIRFELGCDAQLIRKGEWVNPLKPARKRNIFLFKCTRAQG